jgi:hypothetical protein
MQNTDAIFHFRTSHVAFFRPIKRSYIILSWHANSGKWIRFTGDLPNLSINRSLVTDNGAVRIKIAIRPNRAANLIDIRSRGYYLQSGETRIVLLEKDGSLPQPFSTVEYNLANPALVANLTEEILWSTQPPPLDIPPPSPAPAPVSMVPLKAIPKRIAWLIAEEASKAEESCPILSEPISPVTSAVTTCFHVFDYDAINEWFARNPINTKCPVCRDPCLFTRAFTD